MSVEQEIVSLIESELESVTDGFVATDDFEYMVGEALGWGGTVDINEYIDYENCAGAVRELLDLADESDYITDLELKIDALQARHDRLETIITDTFRILLNRLSA